LAETIGLSEAVRALQKRYGERLEAGRDEGRDMLADALAEDFGLARGEAEELVGALEQAQTILWVGGEERLGAAPHPAAMAGKTPTTDAQHGYAQAPIPVEGGYWQLTGV
jgi:hypothetical protein